MKMRDTPLLVVVAGPTAIGKTALCVRLAQQLGSAVLSADSRQFYREMCIGTAKPTEAEMQGVPHYFVGHLSVAEPYTAGQYEQDALALLDELFATYPVVLLTGGSGLFLKAVCEGFDDLPDVPQTVREQAKALYAQQGLAALQAEVRAHDPAYFQQVDTANPQRLMRALEVIWHTGQPFSAFRKGEKKTRPFRVCKILLERPREELYARINERVGQMLAQGLVREAETLYPHRHLNALQTVGYKEIFDFWDGAYGWDEAVRLLKQNTRRYAKRQLTWFRRDPDFQTFHPEQYAEICAFVEEQRIAFG